MESSTLAAIRGDRTANLEKNSPLKTAEKGVRSEGRSASDLAPRQPGKARAEQGLVSVAPVMRGYPPAAKKRSENGSLWPKTLALAAFTGVLALVLFEEFPLPRLGQVEARSPGSAVAQKATASPTDGPSAPPKKTAKDSRDPRILGSDQSEEFVVRKFPTDLNVASENSGNTQELRRIFFNEDSDVIGGQYRPWLQQIADALAGDPTASAILEGHTDGFGPEAYNLDLSSRRAIAVRNALVNDLHVSRTQLTAIGAGSAAPLQPNSNATGRAYNRRVEVRLIHSSE
jgi:outer membrane protein OmpA-like peptidoglycan-associated protein